MDNDNLLHKWLNGELTEAELQDFEKSPDFEHYQSIIKYAENFKASNFQNVDTYEKFKGERLTPKTQHRSFMKTLMPALKIAAACIIIFGLYFFFTQNSLITITTIAGEKTNITLPDTSTIVLNASSSVSYHKKDWKENRLVTLDGEAFFQVAKGATFDVITQKDTVTVLGTEFNVKKRSNYFEVTCYEGSVKVSTGNHQKILAPGDQLIVMNSELIERKLSDTKPNWTQNFSTFSAVPLQEVFDELARQFDVKITTTHIDSDQLFTGGFQHENLEKALQSVTTPMNIRYEFATEKSVILYEKHP
ncbi:FecR family protein [Kordia zhangzhouensis]|uniref:FecR family protein n=1 Tax=Kordia zhangzhouensis TaxID=1620405 RepID=UPI000629B1F2|nr:FecR domain-containing protein [Kordia zhangzhouensis]